MLRSKDRRAEWPEKGMRDGEEGASGARVGWTRTKLRGRGKRGQLISVGDEEGTPLRKHTARI